MRARVLSAEAQPGKLEELVLFFNGERTQEIRQAPGNLGFFVLADPVNNRILNLSLWESDAAAAASQSLFREHAAIFGRLLAGAPTPASYDVKVQAT